jgi:hypothetical protein
VIRKSGIILGAVLAIVAVTAIAGFPLSAPPKTDIEEFVARPDRFSIPADWRLEGQHFAPVAVPLIGPPLAVQRLCDC